MRRGKEGFPLAAALNPFDDLRLLSYYRKEIHSHSAFKGSNYCRTRQERVDVTV